MAPRSVAQRQRNAGQTGYNTLMPYKDSDKRREYQAKWVGKRPGYLAKTAAERRQRKLLLVRAHKIQCVFCGYDECQDALDFHHPNGDKTEGIGKMARECRSDEAILAEIAKCWVLCANCHRKQHCRECNPGNPRQGEVG